MSNPTPEDHHCAGDTLKEALIGITIFIVIATITIALLEWKTGL